MKKVFHNVFRDGKKLYTLSSDGVRVYTEHIKPAGKKFYREWDPTKSKLGSAILNGLKNFPFKKDSNVLYLGCAQGTTASHVADIVDEGLLVGVDFSQKTMENFIPLCERRENMVPVLADARKPEEYTEYSEGVDVIYQDVAQPNQAKILLRNAEYLKKGWALLCIKARSVDVTARPSDVFRKEIALLEKELEVVETVRLEPFEKDHALVVCRK